MNELYDIYFVGVGGQGVLTIGEIIAEAAFRAACRSTSTRPRAWRSAAASSRRSSGSAASTPGPAIPEGGADLVIATEVSEALKAVASSSRAAISSSSPTSGRRPP